MKPRRKEPPVPPPVDVPASDRAVLIDAYKSGLIKGWKRDGEQSYRLTLHGQGDAFVEVSKLARYLAGLRKANS